MISASEIEIIIPLLHQLNDYKISETILLKRVREMVTQNYECLGLFKEQQLIGVCGMWFQTRHYAGKSMEMDHVIIDNDYRGKGIGKLMMQYIYNYANKKECNWIELNTYVHNFPSHKFYYKEGFIAKGFHFIKKL